MSCSSWPRAVGARAHPRAFVVLMPDQEAGAEELIDHCRARIARYKAPKGGRVRRRDPQDLDLQSAEVRAPRTRMGQSGGAHQGQMPRPRPPFAPPTGRAPAPSPVIWKAAGGSSVARAIVGVIKEESPRPRRPTRQEETPSHSVRTRAALRRPDSRRFLDRARVTQSRRSRLTAARFSSSCSRLRRSSVPRLGRAGARRDAGHPGRQHERAEDDFPERAADLIRGKVTAALATRLTDWPPRPRGQPVASAGR